MNKNSFFSLYNTVIMTHIKYINIRTILHLFDVDEFDPKTGKWISSVKNLL